MIVILLLSAPLVAVKEDVLNGHPFISELVGKNTAARLMVNWIAGLEGDPIDVDDYTQLMTEVLTKSRSREFELLTFYMRTYEKDMVSKCKIAMKSQEKDTTELYFLFERCDGFGRFIGNHIHISPSYFYVSKAFKFFFDMLTSGLFRFDFGESDLEGLRRNALFLQILQERIVSDLSAPIPEGPYKSGFRHIEDFFAPMFMRVFASLLPDGKLTPHRFNLNKETQEALDQAFEISPNVVKDEKDRIARRQPAEGNDDFSVITRYYKGQRGMPLYNFNVSFKLNKNQPL